MAKKHNPAVLICSLRQICEICGAEYGRILVKNNRVDRLYLESLPKFRAKTTCGRACGRIKGALTQAAKKNGAFNQHAMAAFLGAPA